MSNTTYGPKGARLGSTLIAGAVISLGTAVKRGADQNTAIPGTAASVNIGIATDDQTNVGRAFPVAHMPGEIVDGRAGAAFALDALLTSDATGRLVTATTGQAVTAIARQVATAADQLVPVELVGPRVLAP
jgi:hypothetical protein